MSEEKQQSLGSFDAEICPACKGKKTAVIYTTYPPDPDLSESPCIICGGTGKRTTDENSAPVNDFEAWVRVTFEPIIGPIPMVADARRGQAINCNLVKRLAIEKLGVNDPRVEELKGRLLANSIGGWMN